MVDLQQSHGALPGWSGGSAANGAELDLPVLVTPIRLMHEGDIEWTISVAKKHYRDRYDWISLEGWIRNILFKSPLIFYPARTEHAFTVTMLSSFPWTPSDWEAHVVLTYAEPGAGMETVRLLRDSIAWARLRKCVLWQICSDTEHDFGPLARRVGAMEIAPRYRLTL